MPYTKDSANLPDYVKDLPESKRAQWVETFNSAYASCEKDNGEDCEGRAFKMANAILKGDEQVDNELAANVVDKVYRTSWDGRDWLVVPTVMIREGVLNGELVPAEELAKFPGAWNGRPFVIDHPRENDGTPISAAAPNVLDKFAVGYVFGAEYDETNKSVPAELWLDLARAQRSGPGNELVKRVLEGKPVEVSTGYFRDRQDKSGEWGGMQYDGIARNLRPDHLAALLKSVGACSWEDGCGCPRVNEDEDEQPCTCGMLLSEPADMIYNAGDIDAADAKENEAMNGNDNEAAQRDSGVMGALRTLMRAIGVNVDGDAHGEDMETMAKSKEDMVGELVKRLELNADEASEGLSALSASTLRAILNAMGDPPADEPDEEEPEEEVMPEEAETQPEPEPETQEEDEPEEAEPQANDQPCAEIAANQDKTIKALERRIADLEKRSEAQQGVVRQYQEAQASEKAKLVSDLAANERCAFSKDELEDFDVPKLQKLARSLTPRSYAGQEGGPTANQNEDDRPVVLWNPRAAKEK